MLRSSLPTLMTEDQLSAVKAALTAAAAGNPCGEEQGGGRLYCAAAGLTIGEGRICNSG